MPSSRAYDSGQSLWGIKQLSVFDTVLGNEIPIDKVEGSRPAESAPSWWPGSWYLLSTGQSGTNDLTPHGVTPCSHEKGEVHREAGSDFAPKSASDFRCQ